MPEPEDKTRPTSSVPANRTRRLNNAALRTDGSYVVYWMTMFRRTRWNFALERAVELANQTGRPLVILEALRLGYPWANRRIHQFITEGMLDNQKSLGDFPVAYYPYLEREAGEGKGLLESLAAKACAIVGDDFPCFFLPTMHRAVADRLTIPLEVVDSNGIYPMHATEKVFSRAYDFRRHLQKEVAPYLSEMPASDPLNDLKTSQRNIQELDLSSITARWPKAQLTESVNDLDLASLPLDQSVGPASFGGGSERADRVLKRFLDQGLHRYASDRNSIEPQVASGLSPYLHFGHISSHELFVRVAECEKQWTPLRLGNDTKGSRTGWWGMSEGGESFLDQILTWRELGYNFASKRTDYDQFSSLPDWAQKTINEHRQDPRPEVYSLEQLEAAQTQDDIWNAAQRELVRDGRMHNYLRMLWGKKVYQWSETPEQALETLIHLNNKYAVDGRNPNSYSGIFWCFGRYDRAWGPERPIFGKLRYMTSDSTRRKLKLKGYLEEYGGEQGTLPLSFD